MKRLKRNPAKFESLELFGMLGRDEGYSFKDEKSSQRFLNKIGEELKKAKNTPTTLHGLHAEAMFGCLAATLGKCSLVKKEDAGEIYSKDESLKIPDYRVVLDSNQEFLVEVKNYYQDEPLSSYSFTYTYLESLRKYANLVKCDLKIAIYWTKWNIWTLFSEAMIKDEGSSYSISMIEACMVNEMYLLGDYQLATRPPLKIRIITDKSKPISIGSKGDYHFTIEGIELYCGNTLIEDDFEKTLAFFFMLFGNWQDKDPAADVVNNKLEAVEFISEPIERNPDQEFEIIGSISGMFALHYNMITAPEGDVEKISPRKDPESLVYSIPKDYKGKYLPLRRFTILPKNKA